MKAVPDPAPDRELRAETTIDAPPDRVWAVLSDVRRMPELSPELVAGHADELEAGMARSVARLKALVE